MSGDTLDHGPHREIKRFSAGTIAVSCVAVVIAAYVISWPYSFAGHYSPLVYLNILITFGGAWLIGKAAELMIRKHRINTGAAAAIIGLVGGFFLLWFAWLVYVLIYDRFLYDQFDLSAYTAVINPAILWNAITFIAHNPMWVVGKSGGSEPAFFYYAVWLIEAGVLVFMPAAIAASYAKSNRLCESCGDWLKSTGDLAFFLIPEGRLDELRERIAGGDVAALADLPRPKDGDESVEWFEAHGHACPNCKDEDSRISVLYVALKYNKKSKQMDRTQKEIVKQVPVDVELEKTIFEAPAQAEPESDGASGDSEIPAGTGESPAGGREAE